MPGTLTLESIPQQAPPPQRKWTRQECQFMADHGLFDDQRYELVEGILITKMGHRPPHFYAILTLANLLPGWFPERVSMQLPLVVDSNSEPQPDLVVLRPRAAELAGRLPGPDDVAWLMEVSDSTLQFDLTVKSALYARAGIDDYWVMDLVNRRLIVHREPQGGEYHSVTTYDASEEVAPLMAPDRLMSYERLSGDIRA